MAVQNLTEVFSEILMVGRLESDSGSNRRELAELVICYGCQCPHVAVRSRNPDDGEGIHLTEDAAVSIVATIGFDGSRIKSNESHR